MRVFTAKRFGRILIAKFILSFLFICFRFKVFSAKQVNSTNSAFTFATSASSFFLFTCASTRTTFFLDSIQRAIKVTSKVPAVFFMKTNHNITNGSFFSKIKKMFFEGCFNFTIRTTIAALTFALRMRYEKLITPIQTTATIFLLSSTASRSNSIATIFLTATNRARISVSHNSICKRGKSVKLMT